MTWYTYILIGFILGMGVMYQLVKPDLGDEYVINNKVKNRKGIIKDSSLNTKLDLTETKTKRKLRDIFKRKNGKKIFNLKRRKKL